MANDGVIKIGFSTDVQSFIKEIKKELSSVKDWGLSDSLKDEIKDIESMLDGLSKSFSEGLNSKLDTKTFAGFEKKVTEDMATIDKRVSALENDMQALISTMSGAKKTQFESFIKGVTGDMERLDVTTKNVTTTMKNIVDITSKSKGVVQVVDDAQIQKLKKEEATLNRIKDLYQKIGPDGDGISINVPTVKKDAIAKLQNVTEKVKELSAEIKKAQDENASSEKIATLQEQYFSNYGQLISLNDQISKKWGGKSIPNAVDKVLGEACDKIESYYPKIRKRMNTVSEMLGAVTGGTSLSFNKDEETIKVPMDVDVTREGFYDRIKRIISYTQKKIDTNPLQVEFVLTSSSKYSNKKTNALLKQWQEQISNIDDAELKAQFEDLYETVTKDFQKQLKLSVTSEIKDEGEKVQKVIDEIKKKLNKNKLKIFPIIDVKEIDIEKLQKKLDRIAKSLRLTISNIQLAGKEDDNFIEKFEAMNNELLSPIAKSLEEIVGLTRTLSETVGRTENPIKEITSAVKELATVLQSTFGIVSSVDLDSMFFQMEKSISNINGNLRGGDKNPLVRQLKEILAFYREYKKLGGTKALSDLGGAENVQKWLDKHQNDELKDVGNTLGLTITKGIRQSLQIVSDGSQELVDNVGKGALEAAPTTNKILDELGQSFGDSLADAIVNSKDKVKEAIEQLYKEGKIKLSDLASDRGITSEISDELYNSIVNAKKKSITESTYDSSYNNKYRLKAHKLTAEEKKDQQERWAESLSELNIDPRWASYIETFKNLTNIKDIKPAYEQLTKVLALLNTRIDTNQGSADFKEFVTEVNRVIAYLDEQIKASQKITTIIKKHGKSYKGTKITKEDLQEGSNLSSDYWQGFTYLRKSKQGKKDIYLQVGSMLEKYRETSDKEILDAINQIVEEADFSKAVKGKLESEIQRFTNQQNQEVEKASKLVADEYGEGLKSSEAEIKKDGESLGEAVVEGVQESTQTNSPSKVAEKLGEYFGEGYAIGILNTRAKVKNAIRALFAEGVLDEEALARDYGDTAEASSIAFDEIISQKKETKETERFRKKIQTATVESEKFASAINQIESTKANNEIQNIEERVQEFIKQIKLGAKDAQTAIDELLSFQGKDLSLVEELKKYDLGDINFKKILEAEIPESLVGYYRGLENYFIKAQEIINKGEGSDEFLRYVEKVDSAIESIVYKLSTQGWILNGNKWINIFDNVVTETSHVDDNLDDVSNVLNTSTKEADKFANAIARAKESSVDFLTSNTAQKEVLQSDLKASISDALNRVDFSKIKTPNDIWDEFITDAGKAYDNVHLVEAEVNKIASVNFSDILDKTSFGRLRNQITNDNGEIASYIRTFEDVIDVITRYRTIERDGVKEREPFDTTVFNYAKVEKKIFDYDSEIAKLAYQIKSVTEEEAAPLSENLKILEDERDLYLEILKYAVGDNSEVYDKSSYASFEQRRNQNRTILDNSFQSKEIALSNKELREQTLLRAQINTKMSELVKLEDKLDKKGLPTDGIERLATLLFKVEDKNGLAIWNEELKQFRNEIALINPEIDKWEEKLKEINSLQSKELTSSLQATIDNMTGADRDKDFWKKVNGGSGEWTGALAEDVNQINSRFDLLIQKYQELAVAEKEVTKQGKLFEKNPEVYAESLQKAKDLVSEIYGEVRQLSTEDLLNSLTDEQVVLLDKVQNSLEEIKQKQAAIIDSTIEKTAQLYQKMDHDIAKVNQKSIAAAQSGLLQLNGKNFQKDFVPEVRKEIDTLTVEFKRLFDLGKNGGIIPKEEIDAATLRLRELKNEVVDVNKYFAATNNVTGLYSKIANFMNNNTAMSKEFKMELKDIMAVLNSGLPIVQSELVELESRFNSISGKVRELGQTGNSLFTAFTKQLKSANAQFLTTYFSLQDWIRYARQAIDTITELDYALIDLRKTTSMNSDELDSFYLDANDTAKNLGVTTKQIIEQAAAWSRLGYSSKEAATEMAALSSQFKQISPGMDLDNATDGLVSTMKAFHIDVADAEREIMDVINKTGNTMATTNEEIVEMLKRSSAAMSAANNSIKETIALESAAVQITRNAETTGTAFRTISMRIRGYDEETEEFIGGIEELTGKVADLTKTAKTPGGITLFTDDTKTEYKSTYEILKDISEIYHDLTDKNQAELLETLAGKRGGQVLAGILDDFSEVERAMQNMEESAGSADAEMAIVEESIDYKINNLRETWVGIVQELIDRGYLGQIVDFLTKISEVIGDIVTGIGPVPTIISGIGLEALITNLDKIESIKEIINTFIAGAENEGTIVDVISETIDEVGSASDVIDSVQGSIETIDGLLTEGEAAFLSFGSASDFAAAELAVADGAMAGTTVAAESATGAVTGLGAALKGFVLTHPVIAALAGIGLALGAAALAWDAFTTTVKEAQRDLDKTSSKIESLKAEIIELQDIDYRTEAQEKRLDSLKQELEYQEKIYEIEQKRLSKEKFGKKFSDIFDADNYYAQYLSETNHQNGNSVVRQFDLIDKYEKSILGFMSSREEYQDYLDKNKLNMDSDSIEEYIRHINELTNAIDEANGKDISIVNELRDKAADFEKIIEEGQEAIDKGWVIGSDRENVQSVINDYKTLVTQIHDKIDPILKREGLFDYSSIISSELSKFGGLKDELVQLAKSGTLTEETLRTSYSKFVGVLNEAGVSAENLLSYLLQISGVVDRKNFADKIERQMKPINELDIGGAMSRQIGRGVFDSWLAQRTEEEMQVLQKSIEHMNWSTYDDWNEVMAKLQYDLDHAEGNPLTVGVEFDTSKFNEQDEDLESLQSLYEKFRDNVEGDTIKVPLDISDVESLREKWETIVSKEAFDEFELKVTTDNASVQDVQNAFDSIVTAYAQAQIKIQGATKETMDMVKSQLKMDGLEPEGVDKFIDAVVAEDKMNAFISTLDKAQDAEGRMADGAVAAAADIFEEARALGITEDMLRDYLIQAALAGNVVLGGDTSWLDELAAKLDIDIEKLRELLNLANQGSGFVATTRADGTKSVHSIYGGAAADKLVKQHQNQAKQQELKNKYEKLNLYPTTTSDAGKAGGDAGDAWVEAYEKELGQLDDLKSQGLISEREYLDRLKVLIDKYFKDRAEYAEKYAQEMQQYMDKMLEHYNSVISGVTTLLDRKISAANKGKDAAIKALQEEQAAAEEAYQAQIDAIQAEIDAIDDEKEALDEVIDKKNEEIDKLNDQIDAINEANAARDRSINLQKAEYELQRQLHQRTKLVYTGEPGQMRYERDEAGVRDAQENLKDAQDDIAIAAIEKQIKLIEDEIEVIEDQKKALDDHQKALQKQQEEIQKMMEASSKYYEKLIEEQEKYWDSIIEDLENTKSKWEELAEVDAVAKAWGLVEDEMKTLGYTVDDVLNDVPGAFEAFKREYVKILEQMHSGDEGYLNGLKNTVGQIPGEYQKVANAVNNTKQPISDLGTTSEAASGGVKSLGGAASTTAGQVGELKTETDGAVTNVQNLANVQLGDLMTNLTQIAADVEKISGTDLSDIVGKLNSIDTTVDDGFVIRFTDLADAIIAIGQVILSTLATDLERMKVATDETTVSNVQQIQAALDLIQQVNISQLVTDFTTLKNLSTPLLEALNGVDEGGGLITALQTLQGITLDDNITAQFNNLEDAVNNVSNAINGSGASGETTGGTGKDATGIPGEKTGGSEDEGSGVGLAGAIEAVKQATTDNIGTSAEDTGDTAIGHFNALGKAIEAVTTEKIGMASEDGGEPDPTTMVGSLGVLAITADEEIPKVISLFDELKVAINSCVNEVTELVGKIENIPTLGGVAFTSMPQFTYTGTANTPHFQGTAKYTGDWSVGKNEKSMVGELGPEIVLRDGHFSVVGKNGPEIVSLKKDDIVLNHLQSAQVLSKHNQISGGPSHAGGTVPFSFAPFNFNESYSSLMAKLKEVDMPTMSGIKTAISEMSNGIKTELQNITRSNVINTTVHQSNTFNVSGVTGEEVAQKINNTLVQTFSGMSLNAYQRSMA